MHKSLDNFMESIFPDFKLYRESLSPFSDDDVPFT